MNPVPTLHSVYMFFPPNSAQLVLHADNHVEIRFERTRTAEILKWWEERTNQFRLELNYLRYGPQPIEELQAPGSGQNGLQVPGSGKQENSEVLLEPVARSLEPVVGQTLPVGTLLSRDQVAQLMRRYPNMKLEGEGLYRACVELGFVKTVSQPSLVGNGSPTGVLRQESQTENRDPIVDSPEPVVVYQSLAEPLDDQGRMLLRPNESLSDFTERARQVTQN